MKDVQRKFAGSCTRGVNYAQETKLLATHFSPRLVGRAWLSEAVEISTAALRDTASQLGRQP